MYLCRVNSRKNYIALLLVVLYLFPVGYQTVHKVLHKGLSGCDHSGCTVSCSEESQTYLNDSHAFPELLSGFGSLHGTWISPEKSSCPVCEYNFTLTTGPETPANIMVERYAMASHSSIIPEVPYTFPGFYSFLRAPPPPVSL